MKHHNYGFTLIELSLVLVIIGLIVGGVLVGRDLIAASEVRAQISQIEKYSQAANTFKTKYNALPGDITDPDASKFGLAARGTGRGQGDGNGVLEGAAGMYTQYDYGTYQGGGETAMFWVDLSVARLVDGTFNTANPLAPPTAVVDMTLIGKYMPTAKIAPNFVYVYSDAGSNFFGVSAPFDNTGDPNWRVISTWASFYSNAGLTVKQAYAMDKKVDDGFPQTGGVTARLVNDLFNPNWAAGGGNGAQGASDTSATPASATTCYDNGNVAGTQSYSVAQNNGMGVNCALSFKMQ